VSEKKVVARFKSAGAIPDNPGDKTMPGAAGVCSQCGKRFEERACGPLHTPPSRPSERRGKGDGPQNRHSRRPPWFDG
jgi:hypothetical protein